MSSGFIDDPSSINYSVPARKTPATAFGVMNDDQRLTASSRNGSIHRKILDPVVVDKDLVLGRAVSSLILRSSWRELCRHGLLDAT